MANRHNINAVLERSPVGAGLRKIAQIVKIGDFTDGGGASGYVDLGHKIPDGAFVIGSKVDVSVAFEGNTSAVLEVGIAGNVDAFADGIDVSEVAVVGEGAHEQAEVYRASETTVRLTVTGDSDFTDITAGQLRIDLYYMSTVPELINEYPDRYDR